jgi:choline dehydrogenase-like flavoprotein
MFINGNDIKAPYQEECDICIIGAGVAGIVLANELKDFEGKVLLVDGGDINYSQESQELYEGESRPKYFPDPSYSRLRFFGGSSNHWQNNTSPFQPIDFEKRSWIPHSGWPISFQDVEPFYKQAEKYCGVDGDGYNTEYWSKIVKSEDVLKSSDVLETQMAKSPIFPVRFYNVYRNALSKQSNLKIISNTNIVDVTYQDKYKKINAVGCVTNSNVPITIKSKVFVLALGGLENARMLLSFNEKHDNNLGNQGDAVGRYFMEHPTIRGAHFFVDAPKRFSLYNYKVIKNKGVVGFNSLTEASLKENKSINLRIPFFEATDFELSDGVSSSNIFKESLSKWELPENIGSHLYNIVSDLDMVAEGLYRKEFNEELFEHSNEISGFSTVMMMEQTPDPRNRITLGETKDRLGIKKLKIDYRITEEDKNRFWKSLNVVAIEYGAKALGRVKLLKERENRLWGSQVGFSQHHMGTTRMSENSDKGVVDKNQLVHGTNNFYVAGSSVFPTGGHVPPTLTISALSIRLALYLKGKL